MRMYFRQVRLAGMAIVFIALLACPGISRAGDFSWTRQTQRLMTKMPARSAPMKTIQAAVDKAKAGDSVRVRGGVYHEGVVIKHSGSISLPIGDTGPIRTRNTSRWKPTRTNTSSLDGSESIPAGKWELVAGRKNTYVRHVCEQVI